MNGPAKSAYRPSTASPHLDEGRRSANDSIPRLKRRSVNVRFNIRPSWFCLLYIVSLTTDWGTWRGTGRWRGSCGPRTSRNNAVHNTESLLFACAMEVGHQPTTLESNDTDAVDQLELHYLRTTRQAKSAALFPVTDSVPSAEGTGSKEKKLTLNQIFYRAGKRGLGGGIPGALAGVMQVLSLMWLRTIINYQWRYGTNFFQALHTLLQEGGVPRLYRGVSFAIVQAPLSRFVSTAANDGIESLLASFSWTNSWGPGRTTVVASIVVGLWRMMLMPIDTMKTVLQVDSYEGFRSLMRRVRAGKIGVLYAGAVANSIAAVMGHYPWFYTFNLLSGSVFVMEMLPSQLLRNACIGIISSVVSDTIVNAVRVIKTTKQSLSSKQNASYSDAVRIILAADGWQGLFGRGLQTRIFANALQSIVFTVVWQGLKNYWKRKSDEADVQFKAGTLQDDH